jgi:hypothetical protein
VPFPTTVALDALPDNGPLNPAAVTVPTVVILPVSQAYLKLVAPALLNNYHVSLAVAC